MKHLYTWRKIVGFLCLALLSASAQGQGLFINEVVSNPKSGGDWVELYNGTGSDIDLLGYYLTDSKSDTTKWTFTAESISSVIKAGDYMIVKCSGNLAPVYYSWSDYETNFKLSSDGEQLRLFSPSEVLVDGVVFPALPIDVSYARKPDGTFCVTTQPTFEKVNDNFACDPVDYTLPTPLIEAPNEMLFSSTQVLLSSSSLLPIYYTLDGTNPTPSSPVYSVPFDVSETTVIKCAHFNASGERSRMALKTLLFDKTHTLPIINITALNHIPSMPDPSIDQWTNATQFNGKIWIEFYETDGSTAFAQYAKFSESGNNSNVMPQINGKVRISDESEKDHFNNHMFPNKPEMEKVYGFQLRNGSQDFNHARIRDAFFSKLVSTDHLIDFGFEDYRPCIVYVNGTYEGILHLREDDDGDFIKNNFPDQKNAVSNTLYSLPADWNDVSKEAEIDSVYGFWNYFFFAWHIDFLSGSEIDAQIITFEDNSPAYWATHDDDLTFGHDHEDSRILGPIEWVSGYGIINVTSGRPNLKHRFAQQYCSLANFMYDSERTVQILDDMEAELEPEMAGQAAFNAALLAENPDLEFHGSPFSTVAEWKAQIDTMRQSLLVRVNGIHQVIKNEFSLSGLADLTATTNNKIQGSVIVQGVKLRKQSMTGKFFEDIDLKIEAIPEVGYRFARWEGDISGPESEKIIVMSGNTTVHAIFEPIPFDYADLHLNEVQAKNDVTYADEFGEFNDWIEIYNAGSNDVDIAGYYLSDNRDITNKYQVKSSNISKTTVPAYGFAVFWLDTDTAQGENHIGFKLNGQDQVYLVYPDGLTIVDSLIFDLGADSTYGCEFDGGFDDIYLVEPSPNATNNVVNSLPDDGLVGVRLYAYPNPSSGVFQLSRDVGEWKIYSSMGLEVARGKGQSIDISAMPSGHYIIKAMEFSIPVITGLK